MSLTLSQSLTRKTSALINAVDKAAKDVKAFRKSHGVKKKWSAHAKVEETRKLSALTDSFDALNTFLVNQMPAHWPARAFTFGYNLPLTRWWWQEGNKEPNQSTNHDIRVEDLRLFVGFVLGLSLLATQEKSPNMARMKDLGIDTNTINTFSLMVEKAASRTEQYNQAGTTPTDAYAILMLEQHAPNGIVRVRENNPKKIQFLAKGAAYAAHVMESFHGWSGAPTVLPRLFDHQAIVSAFGQLTHKPTMDSVGRHDPSDYDALLKTCWVLAEKADTQGDLHAYLLFTSPVKSYTVLARCENGAMLNHFFERLCRQTGGKLPTSEKAIRHIIKAG